MESRKLSRRTAVQLGAAGAAALAIGRPRRARAQDTVVTFWNSGLYPTVDPNDKTKKLEDFYIYQAVSRFQDANPGVTIQIENIPGDPTMFTKYRTASVAKNGPDMMSMWSGSYMLQFKDFLEPMGAYFTPEERARITGWEVVSPDFIPDSPNIYGVPDSTDGTTCIFYNKELFAKAGVDPEASWPTNLDEFLAVLEQLQASGTTPLTVDATGLVWDTWAYWTSQQIGGAVGVNELVTGKRTFASPEYIAASAGWAKMQPFAVPGAETMSGAEAYQMLFTGQAAMTTAGSWIIGDAFTALGDQLGMIKYPDFIESAPITHGGIGGAGNAFIVSNYSQHKDETVAFIKFLMSKEEQKMKVASGEGALSNVTDVDFATIFTDPFKITQQAWANEPSTIFWNDNVYPSELTTEIAAQAQLAWTGQISAEEFMNRIDAKRDELLEG